jgi:hypothetical protein
MNIDFIKWMCEKAGFRFEKRSTSEYGILSYISVDKDFQGVKVKSDFYEVYIYPLLLHRAFQFCIKNELSYMNYSELTRVLVDDKEIEKYLKYIYEQEKNNER